MKQSKKQNWYRKNWETLLIIGILIFGFGFSLLIYFNTDNYFCPRNPDKCVCKFYESECYQNSFSEKPNKKVDCILHMIIKK